MRAIVLLLAIGLTACQNLRHGRSALHLAEDSDLVGAVDQVTSRYQDTLPDLARRYDLGFDEIVAANPDVDPWLPGAGSKITLPTRFLLPRARRDGIVINLASMRLFYFQPSGVAARSVLTFPIGIGRSGWSTPTGKTKITAKAVDPPWRVPQSIRREHAAQGDPLPPIVPPGPDNPLGRHVLRLGMPSYLIHGTNKPDGVGMRVSHGCMRLYPEDIERLYQRVPVGTPVTIVNQPYLVGWNEARLYVEAHQPLADDNRNWRRRLRRLLGKTARASGIEPDDIDWSAVEETVESARGVPVVVYQRAESPELPSADTERSLLDRLAGVKDKFKALWQAAP